MSAAITTEILSARVGVRVGGAFTNSLRAVRFDWLPEDGAAVRLSIIHLGAGCYEYHLLDRAELARAATVDRDVRRLGARVAMARVLATLVITIHPPGHCHGTGATVVYVPAEPVRRFVSATIDACPLGAEIYDMDGELSSLLEES